MVSCSQTAPFCSSLAYPGHHFVLLEQNGGLAV